MVAQSTKKITTHQPSISHHHSVPLSLIIDCDIKHLHSLMMEANILINDEVRRRKRNNLRLRQAEEDRRLIADGEGKIS